MAVARARALRTLQSSLRYSGYRAAVRSSGPTRTQLVQKRFASGGGAHSGGGPPEWVWATTAVVVTIPSCWYLWPTKSHADGHHGGHGDHEEHEEGHEAGGEEEGEAQPEEPAGEDIQSEAPSSAESGSDDSGSEKSDDTADTSASKGEASSDTEESSKDSAETSKSERPDHGADLPRGKGRIRPDADGATDTRKVETDDNKGASKKRIDSGAQKDLGAGSEMQSSAKPPGEGGDITDKQFGLSTTATRHSTQIDQDPEKSKKGSGEPETAKAMGTVDPDKPVR